MPTASQRRVRATKREAGIAALEPLLTSYSIANLNAGYHFRVNGVLDLFPTNYRFYNIRTNERGVYPSKPQKELTEFIDAQLSKAQTAPARRRFSAQGGKCTFCGSDTGNLLSFLCEGCKGKSMIDLLYSRKAKV